MSFGITITSLPPPKSAATPHKPETSDGRSIEMRETMVFDVSTITCRSLASEVYKNRDVALEFLVLD